ncbi:MAG: anion transporter [Methanoregulaceae archaeon]|jgi:Na+/H+ antiporter NhaD/arsenite permease-like protein|nr:anion transporter [Methanoregulaceae archaeon]
MFIPVIILILVFLLIAIRQVGRYTLRIWQIMLAGAIAVLLFGQITPAAALAAINPDVMLFLFGMFVVGVAVQESGFLSSLSHRIFSRAKNPDQFLLLLIMAMGLFSAVLMNDTIAVIGTPLVIALACTWGIDRKGALLALCFAITIGSVTTPIGNPQNFLIASYADLGDGFTPFLVHLGIPTLINLVLAWVVVRTFYPPSKEYCMPVQPEPVRDPGLARLAALSLGIILVLIGLRIVGGFIGYNPLPLMVIALAGAAPLLIMSPRRGELVRKVDWYTLVFFAALFVLMQSVFDTGFFQSAVDIKAVTPIPVIMIVSVVISQFISNVPFVALFQPLIIQQGMSVEAILALAAGSTIAGNLTVLGAASNVIVIQNAERQGVTITFLEFLKLGLPLTIVNVIIYSVFLSF